MERRFRVRLDELLGDAEVRPGLLRGVLSRLEAFLRPFADAMRSPEQRTNARQYVQGLLSDLPSKDAESIAYLHDRSARASRSSSARPTGTTAPCSPSWPARSARELGEADAVLVFDPSAFPKKGTAVGRRRSGSGAAGWARSTTARSASTSPTSPARSTPWSMSGSTCPGSGRGRPRADERGRRAQGRALPHPARTGPGDARRARPGAAARVGGRGRRDGPVARGSARSCASRGERYLLAVPSNTLVRDLARRRPAVLGARPAAARSRSRARTEWRAALPEVGVADGRGARRGEGAAGGAGGVDAGAGQGGGPGVGRGGDAGGVPGAAGGRRLEARLPAVERPCWPRRWRSSPGCSRRSTGWRSA